MYEPGRDLRERGDKQPPGFCADISLGMRLAPGFHVFRPAAGHSLEPPFLGKTCLFIISLLPAFSSSVQLSCGHGDPEAEETPPLSWSCTQWEEAAVQGQGQVQQRSWGRSGAQRSRASLQNKVSLEGAPEPKQGAEGTDQTYRAGRTLGHLCLVWWGLGRDGALGKALGTSLGHGVCGVLRLVLVCRCLETPEDVVVVLGRESPCRMGGPMGFARPGREAPSLQQEAERKIWTPLH